MHAIYYFSTRERGASSSRLVHRSTHEGNTIGSAAGSWSGQFALITSMTSSWMMR